MKQFRTRTPKVFWVLYCVTLAIIPILTFMVVYISTKENHKPCVCDDCSNEKIENPNAGDITFVSVPRPFMKRELYKSNKLAISSWLACSNRSKVILFVKREEFDPEGDFPGEMDKLYGSGRITYAGPIRSDHNNIPYIDDWFRQGVAKCTTKFICFINGDIVLSNDWLYRVRQVYSVMHNMPIVLIGQRIDFDLQVGKFEKLNFTSPNFLDQVDRMVQESTHEDHSPMGIDTFTFRADKPPFDVNVIPPFIMGRYNWDNWLTGYMTTHCITVTFNLDPPIYHVNHVRHSFDPEDPKVSINDHLKYANHGYYGSNYDTIWQIKNGELWMRGLPIRKKLPNIDFN